MSRVSVEPHHDRIGRASVLLVSKGQSPTLIKNSTSGTPTFDGKFKSGIRSFCTTLIDMQFLGRKIKRQHWCYAKTPTGSSDISHLEYLSCKWEQHFIWEHFEVCVFPQSAAVQLVVDDGVVNETSPVGESVGNFLSQMLQVNWGKSFEVRQNLRFLSGTLHGALPDGGINFWTVTVFMIDWTWALEWMTQYSVHQHQSDNEVLFYHSLSYDLVTVITTWHNTNLGCCRVTWRPQHPGEGPPPSGPSTQTHTGDTSQGRRRPVCPEVDQCGYECAPSCPVDLSSLWMCLYLERNISLTF